MLLQGHSYQLQARAGKEAARLGTFTAATWGPATSSLLPLEVEAAAAAGQRMVEVSVRDETGDEVVTEGSIALYDTGVMAA